MLAKLDLAVKIGALTSIALYIGGFIVVSIHDGTYGFVSFNFFRARLISAGILLAFFIFIAALEAARVFGLSGLKQAVCTPIEANVQIEGVQAPKSLAATFPSNMASDIQGLLSKCADLFLRAWVIGFLLRILLQDFDFGWRIDVFFALILFGFFAAKTGVETAVQMHKIRNRPLTFATMDVLVMMMGVAGLVLLHRWAFLELIGWFFLIALQTTEIGSAVRSGNLFHINWHTVAPMMLATIGMFALAFYPRMLAGMGGGQPIEVHFDVTVESPITKSFDSKGWLVDEIDSGFYVAHSQADHRAVFIPRQSVAAMQFYGDETF